MTFTKPPQMQRRHFQYVADALGDMMHLRYRQRRTVAERLAEWFKATNRGFQRDKFLEACQADDEVDDAWKAGLDLAHGVACHNVPKIGVEYLTERDGRVTCDVENAKELHETLCREAVDNAKQFTPFEFTAQWMNDQDEVRREVLWEAFDEGVEDAIARDLASYDIRDYVPDDRRADVEELLGM